MAAPTRVTQALRCPLPNQMREEKKKKETGGQAAVNYDDPEDVKKAMKDGRLNVMGGGGGGMGGMGDIMSKVMGNPKAMAAVQKAAQNPRVMEAVQDVMQNGPGAMKKYENDREVKEILDELKGIL